MTENRRKYYVSEDFLEDNSMKWRILLEYILRKADYVEFNILYRGKKLDQILESVRDDILEFDKRKKKIYGKDYLRLRKSPAVESFLKSKDFKEWMNEPIEDPSFYVGDKEVLATITHEGMVIFELMEKTKSMFKAKGIDFSNGYNA